MSTCRRLQSRIRTSNRSRNSRRWLAGWGTTGPRQADSAKRLPGRNTWPPGTGTTPGADDRTWPARRAALRGRQYRRCNSTSSCWTRLARSPGKGTRLVPRTSRRRSQNTRHRSQVVPKGNRLGPYDTPSRPRHKRIRSLRTRMPAVSVSTLRRGPVLPADNQQGLRRRLPHLARLPRSGSRQRATHARRSRAAPCSRPTKLRPRERSRRSYTTDGHGALAPCAARPASAFGKSKPPALKALTPRRASDDDYGSM